MTKETITETARALWEKHHERNPRRLCRLLDITIIDLPMGTDPDSIQAFVQKNSRCYCIVLNSDLSEAQQHYALFYEIGHVALKHKALQFCTSKDMHYSKETSVMEIEANEFVAEYLMDTETTVAAIKEAGSFFQTACILRVPLAIMDFKYRMLLYYGLVSSSCPIYTSSDCMKGLDCEGWEG